MSMGITLTRGRLVVVILCVNLAEWESVQITGKIEFLRLSVKVFLKTLSCD